MQHFDRLIECIRLESEAEAKRLVERRKRRVSGDEEASGETLLDMVIEDIEPSLGDRLLLTFRKRNQSRALPWNRLRSGSPVVVSREDAEDGERAGIVSRRSSNHIQIVVNSRLEGERFRIDRSPDEITRKRQLAALSQVIPAGGRAGQLRDVLLFERTPGFENEEPLEPVGILNESQHQAIQFALAARDVAIIHGPPGTGKTTTVVELIDQAVRRGQRVLASGPSNTSVDNLLMRLAHRDLKVVRLGHPARVAQELQANTLDALVADHDHMPIAREMVREAEELYRRLDRFTRAKPPRGARQEMRAEAKELKAQARMLERQAVRHVVDAADVICTTTTGDNDVIKDHHFDLAVVDEACQSTEPGCWIPLLKADRLVLAGDHCQLPPTVLSEEARQLGFQTSLMERLVRGYGDSVTRRLDVQYRMHEQIMQFSSAHFYDHELVAHESVRAHTLADLSNFRDATLGAEATTFIDTAGAGWEEELEPNGESKLNPEEGRLILKKAHALTSAGLAASDIAVIAPYAAQVRWLRDHCEIDNLEIDTVDGFQGREKEAVLITLVRSNRDGEIGFLADARRLNVALTRARRKLIVIGDSATLCNDAFFMKLLEYFEGVGGYHSVWEEEL